MFTQRATLLGFVAFCFYLIAVVNSLSGFYYALTWLSMAMLAASLGAALLSLVGLSCQMEVTRSRGAAPLGESEGSAAVVSLTISNAGSLNKTNILLEIRVIDSKKQVQSLRFLVEALPSGSAIESNLPLTRLRRGKYQLQHARLTGSDVLGLFRMQKTIQTGAQSAREIVIGPPVLKGESVLHSGINGFLIGQQRALSTRQGDELRGTRPYAPGDDLRHVHWKSSARAGELVVKEWEQTGQSNALVLWDGAAQTSWGVGDFNSGEWGLILAGSLCHSLLASGIPCDFARLDSNPLLVESRALVSGELPTQLTEALSSADAGRLSSLEDGFHSLPRLASRLNSHPVVVSASLSKDLVQTVRALRARGAQVRVLLIDAASLAQKSGDPRFKPRGGKLSVFKLPSQSDGGKDKTVAISPPNFKAQVAGLREAGAIVISVSITETESAEAALRSALRLTTQGPGYNKPGEQP